MHENEIPQNFTLSLKMSGRMMVKVKKKRVLAHSPMGWVSYLHRAATTNYLCCGQALEDSLGAGRIGLTHTFLNLCAKVRKKNDAANNRALFFGTVHDCQ